MDTIIKPKLVTFQGRKYWAIRSVRFERLGYALAEPNQYDPITDEVDGSTPGYAFVRADTKEILRQGKVIGHESDLTDVVEAS